MSTTVDAPAVAGQRRLLEGCEAIVESAISAGCRFFAGYPMTPFTEVLEHFAERLPQVGGVCVNAESELEAVGMAWGAASTGARAATGSTGQGLSLMLETLAEATPAQLPMVLFNMARGQADYSQATRGGGHGDGRRIVLAPADVPEAVELTQLAFHLADTWRNPVLVYADFYTAHTYASVDTSARDFGPVPDKPWGLDGSSSGTGAAKIVSPIDLTKGPAHDEGGYGTLLSGIGARMREIALAEQRYEATFADDAEHVVVAFGTAAKYAGAAVERLRAEGVRVGLFRPITLWPYPFQALADLAGSARQLIVLENNGTGQMADDVRIAANGRAPVVEIGETSTDPAGFGVGALYDIDLIEERVRAAIDGRLRPSSTFYEGALR